MVAVPVALLVHVPPEGVDDKEDVLPRQTLSEPEMLVGTTFTVTTAVLKHPVAASVCVMVAVPTPTPLAVVVAAVPDTVTTPVLLLVHAPVPVEVSVVLVPLQIENVPVISAGAANTVTTVSTKQPPASV